MLSESESESDDDVTKEKITSHNGLPNAVYI